MAQKGDDHFREQKTLSSIALLRGDWGLFLD
jgi:hypothetical protein